MLPRQPVPLQKPFAKGQLVVQVQVDQSAGGRVEDKIVIDPRVGGGRDSRESLESGSGEHTVQRRPPPPVHQDVEIRQAFEAGCEVLVALPMAVRDLLVVQFSKEARQHVKHGSLAPRHSRWG